MDTMPHMNGVTTLERVQNREEFRNLLDDVSHLPETQRSALLLREIDAMSYEEIAQAMDTTVPGVKSLLVRARIALAESSQSRALTCDDVRVQLAEAAEGLAKVDGPARRHIKNCEPCGDFRKQLRKDSKVLAALFPAGPLIALKGVIAAKLSGVLGGGGSAAGGAGAAGAGAAAAGAGAGGGAAATGAAVGGAAAVGGGAAGGAATAVGAAIGTKAAAGLATAAILAGGAAEIKHVTGADDDGDKKPKVTKAAAVAPALVPPPPAAAETPAATPPADEGATAPGEDEVVVEPVPVAEGEGVDGLSGGLEVGDHKKKEGVGTTDGSSKDEETGTGAVGTGLESSCDADGDGIQDATCSSDGTSTSTLEQAEPAPPVVKPKPKPMKKAPAKSAPKKTSKKK
jgi:hypothetical protein